MKYDIHKDKNPKETVKKIKRILEEIGIETTETIQPTAYKEKTSVRIEIKGTGIGTNGKGTCITNALASGYGEFMERLQSQLLFEFSKEPDAKVVDINEVKDNFCVKNELPKNINFEKFAQSIKNIETVRRFNNSLKQYFKTELKNGKVSLIPFKGIKSGKKEYIPEEIKKYIQTSNGYASGNTYEEAFVQALSEVCERYEQKKIISERITMPDVPYEYYSKYDNIVNLKKYIEDNGYKVTIKDASRNELPVIIIIFEKEDKISRKYCLNAGSHPFLAVAIERTLTEFLQGFDVRQDVLPVMFEKYQDIDAINLSANIRTVNIEHSEYFDFLFYDKPNYDFNPEIWEFDENITNKEMAKTLSEKVLNITDDIYVRNCNFLGFPAISLYIPKMSSAYPIYDNYIKYMHHYDKTIENLYNKRLKEITAEDIYYICEYGSLYNHCQSIKSLFLENMCLFQILSAILLQDEYKIKRALYYCIKECNLIEYSGITKLSNKIKYEALQYYYNLKFNNKNEDEAEKIIIQKYGSEILQSIQGLISKVTIKKLTAMIYKNFEQYRTFIENSAEKNYKILYNIRKKLSKKYTENPPEQEHFIDFLYE